MNVGLLRESPSNYKKLKELDDKTISKKGKSYTIDDILNNLDSINMGRAITTRDGALGPINKNIILSPYSSMYQIYSGNVLQSPNDKNMLTDLHKDRKIPRKRMMRHIGAIVKEFVNSEHQHFANVLCGLTQSNMYRIIMDYKRDCVQIAENRALLYDVDEELLLHTRFGCPDRLYPLSIERYNRFAREKYAKLKSPRFNKRFIDSIRFGGARIESTRKKVNLHGPSFEKLCTVERHIGFRRFKFLNNHVGISFEMDGGCFILHERKNGKQQHLWLLKQYRIKGSPLVLPRKKQKRDFDENIYDFNNPVYYGPGSRKRSEHIEIKEKVNG